ncbi:hypothetical protein PUR61_25965 [Streptomyces sp. BE20]|uniref:hypothetical protein n=1 Tax=unclassified Streptomyces TaxID=2593676 RepID=UPI002E779891|nr:MULTISPECIES: hypothetical protein [unclassified Streptomyces]MED7952795.1 hypothetical protein [Streptomyces sp. BE303]MEE1825606.1 hypothetical protein [Streptomyces sp. BE20]
MSDEVGFTLLAVTIGDPTNGHAAGDDGQVLRVENTGYLGGARHRLRSPGSGACLRERGGWRTRIGG